MSRPDGEEIKAEQAHLVVHLGDNVQKTFDRNPDKVIKLTDEDEIEVRPGGVALVMTAEHFELPASVQGQVSPRGLLATVGFAFPTTHVDPGFHDHLSLPFVNSGQQTVKLKRGDPIGKVELQALHRDVAKPWFKTNAQSSFSVPARGVTAGRSNEVRLRRWQLWTAVGILVPLVVFGYTELLGGPVGDLVDVLSEANIDWWDVATKVVGVVIAAALLAVLRYAWRHFRQRRDRAKG